MADRLERMIVGDVGTARVRGIATPAPWALLRRVEGDGLPVDPFEMIAGSLLPLARCAGYVGDRVDVCYGDGSGFPGGAIDVTPVVRCGRDASGLLRWSIPLDGHPEAQHVLSCARAVRAVSELTQAACLDVLPAGLAGIPKAFEATLGILPEGERDWMARHAEIVRAVSRRAMLCDADTGGRTPCDAVTEVSLSARDRALAAVAHAVRGVAPSDAADASVRAVAPALAAVWRGVDAADAVLCL